MKDSKIIPFHPPFFVQATEYTNYGEMEQRNFSKHVTICSYRYSKFMCNENSRHGGGIPCNTCSVSLPVD